MDPKNKTSAAGADGPLDGVIECLIYFEALHFVVTRLMQVVFFGANEVDSRVDFR